MAFGIRQTWIYILALELSSHITVGKLLKLSSENEENNTVSLI